MEIKRNKDNIAVAFFDSGIGGLNLLKECASALPQATFYYLADNYNVPYGSKSKEEMLALVKSKLSLLSDVELSAAVVACNTVTANCIEELRAEYSFPIIGIQPAIKPAAEYGGKCLVLATCATVNSRSFKDLLASVEGKYDTRFSVHPCEGLADYIENNLFNIDEEKIKDLLPKAEVDSVVLGCTHYAYIKDIIKEIYNCRIFDGISGTTAHLLKIIGIGAHICARNGIDDHIALKKSNITFLGGDFNKNAQIYACISKSKGV